MKEGLIVTTKDHAAEEMMKDHWTLHMDKFQEGKEPLFQRTNEFFNTKYQECKGPVFQNSPPYGWTCRYKVHRKEDRIV